MLGQHWNCFRQISVINAYKWAVMGAVWKSCISLQKFKRQITIINFKKLNLVSSKMIWNCFPFLYFQDIGYLRFNGILHHITITKVHFIHVT